MDSCAGSDSRSNEGVSSMRDRFALAGGGSLLVAIVLTAWFIVSRSAPATDQPQIAVDVPAPRPTATLATSPTPVDRSVALVVHLDGISGSSSFAQAGDRIDLLAYLPAELAGQATTRVLLHDVLVLDSGTGPSDSALTVEVLPEDAVLVVSATNLGARPFAVIRPVDTTVDARLPDGVTDEALRARVGGPPILAESSRH